MTRTTFTPSFVDEHIGKRLQLRRNMMGLSQKDLAQKCGVTFQQIQKYESADNRVSASRLFEIGNALNTPVEFFFNGLLPKDLEPEQKNRVMFISAPNDRDPLSRNESLRLINLYWKLPNDEHRHMILKMLHTLNGIEFDVPPKNKD